MDKQRVQTAVDSPLRDFGIFKLQYVIMWFENQAASIWKTPALVGCPAGRMQRRPSLRVDRPVAATGAQSLADLLSIQRTLSDC